MSAVTLVLFLEITVIGKEIFGYVDLNRNPLTKGGFVFSVDSYGSYLDGSGEICIGPNSCGKQLCSNTFFPNTSTVGFQLDYDTDDPCSISTSESVHYLINNFTLFAIYIAVCVILLLLTIINCACELHCKNTEINERTPLLPSRRGKKPFERALFIILIIFGWINILIGLSFDIIYFLSIQDISVGILSFNLTEKLIFFVIMMLAIARDKEKESLLANE